MHVRSWRDTHVATDATRKERTCTCVSAARESTVGADWNDKRRHEIPPWQPGVVPVQPRLGAHPPAEVRQRRDDCRLHRVERRAADAVREHRRLQWRRPRSPAVDDVRLTLDRVHRSCHRCGDGGPGLQLRVVRCSTDRCVASPDIANHSKLWIGAAAALFALGGPTGRRAAATGLSRWVSTRPS